ncbi:sensor histidine kinase [Paenibacillus lutrae]|uniref:histidine kinase n=1 Tax=Paenibacillus lutrae TaxID=2078573 RepID=A0A7X3K0R6_9BACL|nr:sensor histidine kinase [Paenibacillus lutrae]MVP01360.1 HAMP domain-containing protein [Paenibacillus lutrae]
MKAKLTGWFRKQRIKNKIMTIFIPLVVIPLFLLGLISYYVYTQSIIEKTKKNVLDESKLIVTRIDMILTNAESSANMIMMELNKSGVRTPKQPNPDQPESQGPQEADELVYRQQLEDKLKFALMTFPDIESAAFIDTGNQIYSTQRQMEAGLDKALESRLLREIGASNGRHLWFPLQVRDYLVSDKTQPVLTLGKNILDTESMDSLGVLVLNIKEQALSSVYNTIGPVKQSDYYIADREGVIVSSLDKKNILQPIEDKDIAALAKSEQTVAEIRTVGSQDRLVTAMDFQKLDWKLFNETPLKALTEDTRKVSAAIIIIGLVCVLLALAGALILSRVIAGPVIKLTKNMSRIRDGNFEGPIEVKTSDEVGMLGSGFNLMIGRVKDLLAKVEVEQKKKRELELALMQEQIKPHFFYNTLDLIYVLCKSGEPDEASRATKALADFYRIALSNGKEIIPVREEIRNVYNYLLIQRTRYSDTFDFQIDVPEELMDYLIPKLTFQPLVENSIYHGLKEKGTFGKLILQGRLEGQLAIFEIKDDGVGIAPERLAALLNRPQEEKISFGLASVDERIQLYFGEQYGITVESEPGEGTDVIVTIPSPVKRGGSSDV